MTKVSYSIGPFISPTERSSFAAINVAMVNGITRLTRSDHREALWRLRSLYKELHDRVWLDFAELGIEAVKRGSFLLHYLNSTIQEVVRANFHLFSSLDLPQLEERGMEDAREQDFRDSFREEIRNKIRWETTGIYSRIIPAMFEHHQLSYLDDTIKLQCLFALWSIHFRVEDVALEAVERIFEACAQLQDAQFKDIYASARLAIHIAQIGIYASASNAEPIFKIATERYATLRRTFRERYPDHRFVGDFESAEHELLEDRRDDFLAMMDPIKREFFSIITPEQIRGFFAALE
ncbi:MAG: hypothetical protein M1451_06740 [Acidobacteria bacterium]|nr:hypothetical protein [Acidobacteriota bacterium]